MPCYDFVYRDGPPERIQSTFDDLLDEFSKRAVQGSWNTSVVGAYRNGKEWPLGLRLTDIAIERSNAIATTISAIRAQYTEDVLEDKDNDR